ncbi:MAG TPA: glycosyltransferase family 39 protein [Frateuria sp.]|uniref:ArnT family glycosyltransferase n=1 Tax=Frateuria sp. TaxID=2211372 RepID=UPI002D7F8123|nr:glycosyltransferase family 39 protein [Frateuria sp.]HET6805778.1 glycosyltransferase family 39 protein [Frateuria sp.]
MPPNAYRRTEHLRALWPWLPLWAAAALLAIFSHGPMPLYSTRTLAVAWEMWHHGHWLVPFNNGEPYSEKAPLLFWMIHAGWLAFGVTDVWPRVLEVLFGGTQLVLLAALARRLFPDRPWVARAAPWMLLALAYAFLFGLQIMYDVLLAVWSLAALLCLTRTGTRDEPRWWLFGLCLGFGLLTKGPVMALHVVFPWLLGPLWNDWANQHRVRWYGRGLLAFLLGFAMLLAWALPAGFSGGEAYRQRLFFTQTAGRVVHAFDHARPLWWYVLALPLLMFPFSGWPRAWVALAMLRRPLDAGVRFALCWVVPVFVTFSLISGKQLYYPLPEFAGAVLLLAGAIALLRERHPALASNGWLGTWPLALGGIAFGVFLFVLPWLVAAGRLHGAWFDTTAAYSRFFAVVFLLLGALLLLRSRGEMRRLAFAGLLGTLAINTLFTLTLWPRYDLTPTTRLLGAADAQGRAIGYAGVYEGQFHFAGRLDRPIVELHGNDAIAAFARAHPDGLIVTHPSRLDAAAVRYPLLAQPFRSTWVVVWPATSLADLLAGHRPPEPAQPTRVFPNPDGRARSLP